MSSDRSTGGRGNLKHHRPDLQEGGGICQERGYQPTRIVTSTVMVEGGKVGRVSVKTKDSIPKGKIFQCVKALKGVTVKAPVHIGDVIVANVADTGSGHCSN
mgnify:CR=1 FL=1